MMAMTAATLTAATTSVAVGSASVATKRSSPAPVQKALKIAQLSSTVSFAEASNVSFPGHSGTVLDGVSCPTAGACILVGQDRGSYAGANGTIEVSDTATGWKASPVTVPSPPPPGGADTLNAVSCPAAGPCTAVGDYQDANGTFPLVAIESGSAWQPSVTVALPANSGPSPGASFAGVSCTTDDVCAAVGSYEDNNSAGQAMAALSYGGGWGQAAKAVEVQLPPGASGGSPALRAVSCFETGCLAVGGYSQSFYVRPGMAVAESGGQFARAVEVKAPATEPGFVITTLTGVSCTAPTTCAISGSFLNPVNNATTAMVASEVDGVWQPSVAIKPPANASGNSSTLNGLSCRQDSGSAAPSVGNCVAVGSYEGASGQTRPMFVTETGGTWAQATELSVPSGDGTASLDAVACSAGGACATVGGASNGDGLVALSTATPGVTVRGPGGPSGKLADLSVSLSTHASGATQVTYTIDFRTSKSGALAANSSMISVSVPAGTVPATDEGCPPGDATFTDLTTKVSGSLDLCSATVSDDGGHFELVTPVAIGANDLAQVMITGLANPASPGRWALILSTTSDRSASVLYRIGPSGRLASVLATPADPAAGATGIAYTIHFTTSTSGALVGNSGTITLSAPPGTFLRANRCSFQFSAEVTDLNTGMSGSEEMCSGSVNDNGGDIQLATPVAIGARDRVVMVLTGLANPLKPGLRILSLSTSSDRSGAALYRVAVAGVISGQVIDTSDHAVNGAEVEICPSTRAVCFTTTTTPTGSYTDAVPLGRYSLAAFPPSGTLGQSKGTYSVLVSGPRAYHVNISMPVLALLPGKVSIAGQDGGVPLLHWSDPAPMTVQGCRHGIGVLLIRGNAVVTRGKALDYYVETPAARIVPLLESPPGSGHYTATIPPLYPVLGDTSFSYHIYCFEGVTPEAGLAAGGNVVTIHGARFAGATAVDFGTTPAKSFRVLSSSVIEAVAPPGSGTVSVAVRTPRGSTKGGPLSAYTYISLASVAPSGGPTAGTTNVVIKGSGLGHVDTLWFGDRLATSLRVVSDHEIEAVSPPGSGDVPITIREIGQLFTGGPPSSLYFDYGGAPRSDGAPAIASVSMPPGYAAGVTPRVAVMRRGGQRTGQVRSSATCDDDKHDCNAVSMGFPTPQYPVIEEEEPDYVRPFPWSFAFKVWGAALVGGGVTLGIAAFAAGASLAIPLSILIAAGVLVGFAVLIDPSGTVTDTNGNPVRGATAVLVQSPTAQGPFSVVRPASPGIEPHRNPEVTARNGQFHWDVISDYYKVVASAPGCHAPGDPNQRSVSTPVLPVPPPQVGLYLVLQCVHEAPPAPPRVTSLSDDQAPTAGGTQVEVIGRGFTPSARVSFGQAPARTVTFVSPELLDVTVPAGRGTVAVVVATASGRTPLSTADQLTYHPIPVITGLSPASGRDTSSTLVTIHGSGFSGTELVRAGNKIITDFTVKSDDAIEATLPPGPAGTVVVSVTTAVGSTVPTPADKFRYFVPPAKAKVPSS
ncbi:MAG TPA: IPT/TIG domain-containing protein [Acidimicrobiales bacterium]|nr:IPT/TIG domain-containing protein [Acidimicrobiales bacterium]